MALEDLPFNIPYPSILFLTGEAEIKESIVELFGNSEYARLTSEIFTACFITLLVKRRIKAFYFLENRSLMFGAMEYEIEGFDIYLNTDAANQTEEEDLLCRQLLDAISKGSPAEKGDFSILIKRVIDYYIGSGMHAKPQKQFYLNYISQIDKQYPWVKLNRTYTYLGFVAKSHLTADTDYQQKLQDAKHEYDQLLQYYKKRERSFADFISHINYLVNKEFRKREPVD